MHKGFVFGGLFLVLLTAGIFLNATYKKWQFREINEQAFSQTLSRKQHIIDNHLKLFTDNISQQGIGGIKSDFFSEYSSLFERQGVAFYIFFNNWFYY